MQGERVLDVAAGKWDCRASDTRSFANVRSTGSLPSWTESATQLRRPTRFAVKRPMQEKRT
jgi:hypothetical protein